MKERPKDFSGVLKKLIDSGIRAERIAHELDVSFGAVKRWLDGSRKPKKGTVKAIEHLYGVRVP